MPMAQKPAPESATRRCPRGLGTAGGWERSPADALLSLLLITAIVPSLLLGTVVLRGVIGLRQVLGVR